MIDVVAFGEILWDMIDGKAYIGGAPFNFAAHAVQCGFSAATVSCVGDDALGHAARNEMMRHNVDRRWTDTDPAHATGTVTVALQNGQPTYTIHECVAWDYITLNNPSMIALRNEYPRALYFGTLAQRSLISRGTLATLLDTLRNALVFYDVNLRQDYWSVPLVEQGLAHAAIIKVNAEEARTLGRLLFNGACEPASFSEAVFRCYPAIRIVVVTLGADGCVVSERAVETAFCPCAQVDVVDTVGAGDAFSAAFLAALLRGETAREAAEAGNDRGTWVASRHGAVPACAAAAQTVPCQS
ncbi:MAG TPA: PfkB family carbohydrate kinase [Kiritimatiellia bacterium]|nr:PfkB family carbohydrate kinase [Kiritimatiellia bacterium]